MVDNEDGTFRIVGGHWRLEAVRYLNYKSVACNVLQKSDWDEEKQDIQMIRLNAIHGSVNAEKFVKLYEKYVSKWGDKVTAELFAMPKDTFENLIRETRKGLPDELKEKLDFIAECEAILADPKKVLAIISDETNEIIEKYGDDRKTEVVPHAIGQFDVKQLIPDEEMVVALTKGGYIKRLSPTVYRTQGRGGKGKQDP